MYSRHKAYKRGFQRKSEFLSYEYRILGPELDVPRARARSKKIVFSTFIIILIIYHIIVFLPRELFTNQTLDCSSLFWPKMAILKDLFHPPGWVKLVQKIQILFFFNKDNIKFFYVYKHTSTP